MDERQGYAAGDGEAGGEDTHDGAGAANYGSAGSHYRSGDAVRSESVCAEAAEAIKRIQFVREKKKAGLVSGLFHLHGIEVVD